MGFEFQPVRYNEQKLYVPKEADVPVDVFSSDFKLSEQPVLLGDFNGDRYMDKAIVGGFGFASTVRIHRGWEKFSDGRLNFSKDFSNIFDVKSHIDRLEARDVDGDGDLDILCRAEESRHAVTDSKGAVDGFYIVYGYYVLFNQESK